MHVCNNNERNCKTNTITIVNFFALRKAKTNQNKIKYKKKTS